MISFFCWCCSQSVDFIDGEIRRGEGIVDADSVDTINWLVTRIYGSRLEGEIVAKKTGRVIVSVRPMRDPRFFGSNWLINLKLARLDKISEVEKKVKLYGIANGYIYIYIFFLISRTLLSKRKY